MDTPPLFHVWLRRYLSVICPMRTICNTLCTNIIKHRSSEHLNTCLAASHSRCGRRYFTQCTSFRNEAATTKLHSLAATHVCGPAMCTCAWSCVCVACWRCRLCLFMDDWVFRASKTSGICRRKNGICSVRCKRKQTWIVISCQCCLESMTGCQLPTGHVGHRR